MAQKTKKAPRPGTVNSAKLALLMRPGGATNEDLQALNRLFCTTHYGIENQIEWMLERYSIIKEELGNGRFRLKWRVVARRSTDAPERPEKRQDRPVTS
jgi:hypothetical protein